MIICGQSAACLVGVAPNVGSLLPDPGWGYVVVLDVSFWLLIFPKRRS
jgi:hypothetical protein